MTDVRDIVTQYLKDHKFDGLYSEAGECACQISDMFPCGDGPFPECSAGVKIPCDGTCDYGPCEFHIIEEKP